MGTVVNNKYKQMLGNSSVVGGTTSGDWAGASGGGGTVNIGEIREGQYYDLKTIIQQDIDAYSASH